MKSVRASKSPMRHAVSTSLKNSETSEPSRCSSIAMTRVFGLSGSSMLSWRRDQELSPNKVLQTDGLLRPLLRHSRCRRRPLLA
jgi:hypothetical protein